MFDWLKKEPSAPNGAQCNMTPFPATAEDEDLIAYIDQWAGLLEKEAYADAFQFTDHDSSTSWTPELMRDAIKGYGDASPGQRVTLEGKPTDVKQRKEVTRWPKNKLNRIGEVWYDLNIDGFATDLTATFWIVQTDKGIVLRMDTIHVM